MDKKEAEELKSKLLNKKEKNTVLITILWGSKIFPTSL